MYQFAVPFWFEDFGKAINMTLWRSDQAWNECQLSCAGLPRIFGGVFCPKRAPLWPYGQPRSPNQSGIAKWKKGATWREHSTFTPACRLRLACQPKWTATNSISKWQSNRPLFVGYLLLPLRSPALQTDRPMSGTSLILFWEPVLLTFHSAFRPLSHCPLALDTCC